MMLVDSHEPAQMVTLLKQTLPAVEVAPLNANSQRADYFWHGHGGHTEQVERKHWTEIIPDIDKVEEQLTRERQQAQVNYLLVEDLALPTDSGLITYSVDWKQGYKNKKWFHSMHQQWESHQIQMYRRLVSWFWKLDRAGITVVQSPNLTTTSIILTVLYHNSQQVEYSTFSRYIKVQPAATTKNPVILSLMGLEGAGLGEVRATILADAFGSVYATMTAQRSQLDELLGKGYASQFCKAVGRA